MELHATHLKLACPIRIAIAKSLNPETKKKKGISRFLKEKLQQVRIMTIKLIVEAVMQTRVNT